MTCSMRLTTLEAGSGNRQIGTTTVIPYCGCGWVGNEWYTSQKTKIYDDYTSHVREIQDRWAKAYQQSLEAFGVYKPTKGTK